MLRGSLAIATANVATEEPIRVMLHFTRIAPAAIALLLAGLVAAPAVDAQEKKAEPTGSSIPAEDLTPAEKAEREARKDCKVAICAVFHNRKAEGPDVSCNVLKSWRKDTARQDGVEGQGIVAVGTGEVRRRHQAQARRPDQGDDRSRRPKSASASTR